MGKKRLVFKAVVMVSLVTIFYTYHTRQNVVAYKSKMTESPVQKVDGAYSNLLELYQKKLEVQKVDGAYSNLLELYQKKLEVKKVDGAYSNLLELYLKKLEVQKVDGAYSNLLELYLKKLEDLQKSKLWSTIPDTPTCTKEMHPSHLCTDPDCHQDIPEQPVVRLQNVLNSMRSEDLKTVKRINQLEELQVQHTGKQILFLTGSSSNHFTESQAMLKNFHETIPAVFSNYSLRYYDLGLTQAERAQANMKAADIVICLDTSIRLPKEGLEETVMNVPVRGLTIGGWGGRAPTFIDTRMINYFNTTACIYAPFTMMEAGFSMYHNEKFTRDAIIAPWMACAVNHNCMCPDNSILYCNYSQNKYGICHRYDQAAISLIAMQLFGKHVASLRPDNLKWEVKRGDSFAYFNYLESKQTKRQGT